jgi:hypothetical protein
VTSLFPEQLQALQNALSGTAAKAAAVLGVSIERVEQFLSNVAEFARRNSGPLRDHIYMFVFDGSTSDALSVDLETVVRSIRAGTPVFHVDETLHLVEIVEGDATITQCSRQTEEGSFLGVRVENGTYFREILCGKLEKEDDFLHPGIAQPRPSKWHRPMKEFDLVLTDHKKARIDGERGFRYWYDRSERILLAPLRGTTEELFHRDLFWWLDNYVTDKLDVYAEPTGFGQGKTDIVVVVPYGAHVLELKWLGKNQNETQYGEDDIDPGLLQIADYLTSRDGFICGYLVIYDGRSLEEHETQCRYNDGLRHGRCKTPRILFLESESPSDKSKRIVREMQKGQDD